MTALKELIEQIKEHQDKYIELANKNKDLKIGIEAILTATILIVCKAQNLLEKEKQQIIDAFKSGEVGIYIDGKDYYQGQYEQ